MDKHVTGRQAAIDYLREHGGGPLPVKDVTAEAAKRARLKGKTPTATVAAQIYTDAKKGERFKIAERGMVELLPEPEKAPASATVEGDLTTAAKQAAKPATKPAGKKKNRAVGPKEAQARAQREEKVKAEAAPAA